MSAKILGQVWDLKLSAPKLLVLLAMADHADHNGNNVYPGVDLVAWKTGYSTRQVQRIIKSLVRDGLLDIVSKQPGKVIKYRINLSAGVVKEPLTKCHPRQNVTGDIAMSPEPSSSSSSSSERPLVFGVYEENIGLLTPFIVDSLRDLVSQYSEAWVCDAIRLAVKSEKRSLRYIEGILANWKRDGRGEKPANGKADPLFDGLEIIG